MPITHHKGGTTITGDSMMYFRLCAIKSAVYLETKGIKACRGPVVWKRAAREFGIKGNREAVYAVLCQMVADLQRQQEHVTEENGRVIREVEGREIQ